MTDWPLLRLGAGDWADGVELAHSVGWKDSLQDWVTLSTCAQVLGLRDAGGVLRATGALCDLGSFSSVAKMLVHPDMRRRGMARRILTELLALAPAEHVVTLVATEFGEPVYRQQDFHSVGRIWFCTGRATTARHASPAIELDPSGLAAAGDLDARVSGGDRRRLLAARWQQAESRIGLVRDGELAAFGLRVAQGEGYYVGPVLAASVSDATAVLHALLPPDGRPGRVDVPAIQADFLQVVQNLGFASLAPREEMTWKGLALPGQRALRYAPMNLAVG